MSKDKYVFTRYCLFQQYMTLVFTGLILLAGIVPLFFDHGFNAWTLTVIVVAALVATNLLVSTKYRVQKEGNEILIENIWRKRVYPIEALVEIRLVKFIIPYPLNPYVRLSFNDGRAFVGVIPNVLFIYMRRGGIGKYLEDVHRKWTA
jgi:hypothetical protein